jgi:hypothetical protein
MGNSLEMAGLVKDYDPISRVPDVFTREAVTYSFST